MTNTYVGDIRVVGDTGHYSTTPVLYPPLACLIYMSLIVSYLLIPEEDCFVIFFLAKTLK